MNDYRVNLEIFAGPLDLLLYLVRKEEVDIYDIPIAQITDQYLRYIEIMRTLDIDVAGDFLVTAATLMQIKSAMLLPKAEPQLGADELADPRAELIRQLLEYKRFKDAANLLDAAAERQMERFTRPGSILERLSPGGEPEIDLEQISVWDLLEAFDAICKATGVGVETSQIRDDTPIDLYQIEILHRLQTEGPLTFERIFEGRSGRIVMIGLFLALLEMIREKLAWAEQPASSPSIYVRALTSEPAEQAVRNAILAAEAEGRKSPEAPAREAAAGAPIAISELPAKAEPAVTLQPEESAVPIPIAEVPPKTAGAGQQQLQPAEDERLETAD